MDVAVFDNLEGYGLTFSGLCYNGDTKKVTSANREEYIHLMMVERYFHKARNQVLHFFFGFEDIIEEGVTAKKFFSVVKLQYLDFMLRGSEQDNIHVDDWMQFTYYENYQPTDKVIQWFWTVVHQMNQQDDLHKLLYFWTFHWFLPRDGFHGLPRLSIARMNIEEREKAKQYKPKSQTCLYRLQLPDYDTYEYTKKAVTFITEEYSCFGEA